jgi:NADH:ubiquinone oxidoreductase subunit 3 (subunit A)
MTEYIFVAALFLAGILFVGGGLTLSWLVSFSSPDRGNKHKPYECSEDVIGDARIQFHVSYYLYALVFLIFDVESLFLFPCVKIFKYVQEHDLPNLSTTVLFAEILVFIVILFSGLIYAWKKEVFTWD